MACTCTKAGAALGALSRRALHTSRPAFAAQAFRLPAMSPTMEAGTISSWEVKEGAKFEAGDVLLRLVRRRSLILADDAQETDKATMDVEAQDDGVLAKIIIGDGTGDVPVGKLIAVLAEEGDDLATLEMPSEDEAPKASTSQPAPASKSDGAPAAEETLAKGGSYEARSDTKPPPAHSPAKAHDVHISHAQPLFPSVQFLLAEAGISDANAIKATGKHGRLTKGDVLLHLGRLPSNDVRGTAKDAPDVSVLPEHSRRGGSKSTAAQGSLAGPAADVAKPPDARSLRRMIVEGLAAAPQRLAAAKAATSPLPLHAPRTISFDDIVAGYVPAPSPVAGLDLSLGKAPRVGAGLPKSDPLRMYLEL